MTSPNLSVGEKTANGFPFKEGIQKVGGFMEKMNFFFDERVESGNQAKMGLFLKNHNFLSDNHEPREKKEWNVGNLRKMK